MKLAITIALSHLLSRRRQTAISLMGVSLGVAFFLAVSALLQGSEIDFVKRLVDNAPHVTVYDEFRTPKLSPALEVFPLAVVELRSLKPRTEVRGIRQYKEKIVRIADMPDLHVAPVLSGQAIISYAGKELSVSLNGVLPSMMKHVTTLEEHFLIGTLETLSVNPNGILIGTGLANKLNVRYGQNLTVTSSVGVVKTMKIVGLFQTGNASYDETQTYVLMKRAQNLFNRAHVANRFVLRLNNSNTAPEVARHIEAGFGYKAQSWQEATADLMNMIKVRNTITYGIVCAILLVASFGIYNVISTVVIEKTRDIAIMKSIGFHARDIRRIFLLQGVVVGVIGSAIGLLIGMAMMVGVGYLTFKSPFNSEEINVPVYWGWSQMAIAVGFAVLSALSAAYLPARKAARVHPVGILRGVV